ncbi:MAG: hypothetical protein ABIB47_00815 [Candidatus Woesearchaeota archaeon]
MGLLGYVLGEDIWKDIRDTNKIILSNNLYPEIPRNEVVFDLKMNYVHDYLCRVVKIASGAGALESLVGQDGVELMFCAGSFCVAFILGKMADKWRREFLEDVDFLALFNSSSDY